MQHLAIQAGTLSPQSPSLSAENPRGAFLSGYSDAAVGDALCLVEAAGLFWFLRLRWLFRVAIFMSPVEINHFLGILPQQEIIHNSDLNKHASGSAKYCRSGQSGRLINNESISSSVRENKVFAGLWAAG